MTDSDFIREELPQALDGQRADRVVSFVADISRNEATRLIGLGNVSINEKSVVRGSVRVQHGDILSIKLEALPSQGLDAVDIDLSVVYEDESLLVVDKPAGLVVHPGAGANQVSLVQGLIMKYGDIREIGEPNRPGIVHRLDKDTSGLLVVARSESAFLGLKAQFGDRTVHRVYDALVSGDVAGESGTVDAPIGRSQREPTRQALSASGKQARTNYEVRERFGGKMTRVSCQLETGRTHQIRVHMSSIGHPIVGDKKYRGPTAAGLSRFFLHAESLGFVHPESAEELFFESALPDDLDSFLSIIRDVDAGSDLPA